MNASHTTRVPVRVSDRFIEVILADPDLFEEAFASVMA